MLWGSSRGILVEIRARHNPYSAQVAMCEIQVPLGVLIANGRHSNSHLHHAGRDPSKLNISSSHNFWHYIGEVSAPVALTT